MYSVLDYARKTRYPRKRSALTYFDEEHPSRIDYGKDKFGGPFTEEEVEDVKTVLRMIPLMFVCGLSYGTSTPQWYMSGLALEQSKNRYLFPNLSYSAMGVVIPPLYQLVLYPLFYNAIPTMVQRTGIGFVLTVFSVASCLATNVVGYFLDFDMG